MASYDNKVLTGDQLVYFSGLVKTALASKADSSALSSKQDSLVFNTAYNASTNKVATMADVDDAIGTVTYDGGNPIQSDAVAVGEDESTGDTIYLSDKLDKIDTAVGDIGTSIAELTGDDIIYQVDEQTGDVTSITTILDDIAGAVRNKQDSLVFNTAYNASSNKVATMSDITTALSGISSFSFEIVQSLPQSNISTSKIYLVAKQTSGTNQVYTEYAYVNNAWEIIGDTSMSIDTLSNAEVATIWNTATASAS